LRPKQIAGAAGSFPHTTKVNTVIVGVIPARGGSKRIPGKNWKELLGKPLLGYTIEAALESGVFDRVIVSTDSEDVARIARNYAEDMVLMRDPALANDVAPSSVVALNVVEQLDPEGSEIAHVAQLLPTCPLRDAADIRGSFEFFRRQNAVAQISVVRFGWLNAWWAMERDSDNRIHPLFPEAMVKNSQDLPPAFSPCGAIWWARTDALRQYQTFYAPEPLCSGWEIDWKHGIDIDNVEDWEMAEYFLHRRENDERQTNRQASI